MECRTLAPRTAFVFACFVLVSQVCVPANAADPTPSCPMDSLTFNSHKPNKLYLYFPLSADPTFPPLGSYSGVTPAQPFTAADLPSYMGSVNDLRDAITDVVVSDYCEFNVDVIQTTTSPPTTSPRRTVLAVGSDSHPSLYGLAHYDIGDAVDENYGRIWAGTYHTQAGGPGGALNGDTNSTLERWAYSIGGTVAHEAGHTYGLDHPDGSFVKSGEDPLVHHFIMAAGVTPAQRAEYRRYFNDTNFSMLAANVGLSIQTVHNWDFRNPNSAAAHSAVIEVLSPSPSLSTVDVYTFDSPWDEPLTITSAGTTTFKDSTYYRYSVKWSVPKAWSNGSPGIVGPGKKFHIGTSFNGVNFNTPDPVIVSGVRLYGASGNLLNLAPRLFAYDTGTFHAINGSFGFNAWNMTPEAGPLVIRDLTVAELPRVASIDSMVTGAPLRTWDGLRVIPWSKQRPLEPKDAHCRRKRSQAVPSEGRDPCETLVKRSVAVPVAHLKEGRHIFERVDNPDCQRLDAIEPHEPDSVCSGEAEGFNIDLFPSTTWLVTATVIDPSARHWDATKKRFITGPVESKLFYQVAGTHPDLNQNGVDDAIDIATGASRDADGNGVPDDARAADGEPVLTNLEKVSSVRNLMRLGRRHCPEQPYFKYSGGTPDNFGGAADPSYPSANLAAFSGAQPLRVDYDVPMMDDWFGDSYDLQNRREVCYAAIRVRLDENAGLATNDGFHVGHVGSGGTFSTQAGQAYYPGAPPPGPVTWLWAFDAAGIAALSDITSSVDPSDAILDVYLQDDTTIDHITLWVWYEP